MVQIRRTLFVALILLACSLAAPVPEARLDISLDAATLSELLSTLAPERVEVPLLGEQKVDIRLDDLEVTGFDPTAGGQRQGFVLTSLRLRVPSLGLDVPVEPRLSLQLGQEDGMDVCFLTFEEVEVPMPLGTVDIAPFLPKMPVPVDSAFGIVTDRGDFVLKSRLVDVQMGTRAVRLGFDLDVTPAP